MLLVHVFAEIRSVGAVTAAALVAVQVVAAARAVVLEVQHQTRKPETSGHRLHAETDAPHHHLKDRNHHLPGPDDHLHQESQNQHPLKATEIRHQEGAGPPHQEGAGPPRQEGEGLPRREGAGLHRGDIGVHLQEEGGGPHPGVEVEDLPHQDIGYHHQLDVGGLPPRAVDDPPHPGTGDPRHQDLADMTPAGLFDQISLFFF